MTRALFICPDLRTGGAERHWATLLPLLRDREIDATVMTLKGKGAFYEQLSEAGVPAVNVPDVAPRGLTVPSAAVRAIRSKPDVIVTRAFDAHGIGWLASRVLRVPWVINWHRQPEMIPNARRRTLLRMLAPRAARVILVSETQRPVFDRLGVPSDRLEVIRNGTPVRTPPDTEERSTIRRSLGVDEDRFLAVLVGALRPEKRIDVFIDAVAACEAQGIGIDALVAGDGPERERLEQRASGTTVRFVGRLSEVERLYRAADVACLSSDAEALPMTLLEGMAHGLPVVATDVGGVDQIVRDNETGFLIKPGDSAAFAAALSAMSASRDARAAMGAAAKALQQSQFSSDAMADRYAVSLASARRRASPSA